MVCNAKEGICARFTSTHGRRSRWHAEHHVWIDRSQRGALIRRIRIERRSEQPSRDRRSRGSAEHDHGFSGCDADGVRQPNVAARPSVLALPSPAAPFAGDNGASKVFAAGVSASQDR